MNYVGSISILDRGDAPAQAVIDRNARSLAQRVADETKEELHKVMTRVDNICGNFELASQLYESNRTASLEYANDLADLEELLKDQVKKKKYQQQVTIFVVGYENVCGQKLRLLSQVNEFFMENSNKFEEDEMAIQTPDLDLDEMADTVEETLKTTESLAEKLGELNQEMVEYMYQYAQTKASNKGKKKLEKALNQAKDDINIMNEKLLQLQSEIEEKEDKMQQLFKQIEMKNMEAQRYKTAADVAKKNSEESDKLREEVSRRDVRIKEMRQTIDKLEIELGEVNHSREQTRLRLKTASDQSSSKLKELNKALNENHMASTEAHHELQFLHESQLKDLMEVHQQEVEDINKQHQEEVKKLLDLIEEIKRQIGDKEKEKDELREEADEFAKARATSAHKLKERISFAERERDRAHDQVTKAGVQIKDLQKQLVAVVTGQAPPTPSTPGQRRKSFSQRSKSRRDLDAVRTDSFDSGDPISEDAAPPGAGDAAVNPKDLDTEPGDRSRPVTMETQSTQESLGKGGRKDSFSNKPNASRQNAKTVADSSVQDEGGDPDKAFAESSFNPANGKPLPPVTDEEIITFDDQFELKDDDSWAAVPGNHIPSRFVQYRNLTVKKMDDLENQIVVTVKKTQRKINTLKAQFQEHKSKWEAERNLLIQHIQAAQSMQGQAEEEATAAISQLEEFINEQENLEIQEDEKRKSLGQVGILESLGVTSPIPQPSGPLPPLPDMRPYSPVKTPMSVVTEPESKEGGAAEEEDAPAAEATTEDVGQNLLAQTDDAKVEQARSTPKSRTNLSDGSRAGSSLAVGSAHRLRHRSVTFDESLLREDQQSVIRGVRSMMQSEMGLTEPQQRLLFTMRDALNSVASHNDFMASINQKPSSAAPLKKQASDSSFTDLEKKDPELKVETTDVQDLDDKIGADALKAEASGGTDNPEKVNDVDIKTEPEVKVEVEMTSDSLVRYEGKMIEGEDVEVEKRVVRASTWPVKAGMTSIQEDFNAHTLTIFSLANHLTLESIRMGVEPASLFQIFSVFNSKNLGDFLPGHKMSFYHPPTSDVSFDSLRKVQLTGDMGFKSLEIKHDNLLPASSPFPTPLLNVAPPSRAATPPDNRSDIVMSHRNSLSASSTGFKSPVEKFQINGISTEEIARSASQSRASLREQHRSALSSLKKNVEGRRTHSPMSPTIMRQKSVLSEAELDEDGDMPFPPDITLEERQKVMTMDQGTSPINMPRENTLLSNEDIMDWGSVTVADHPIVQEFLRSYEGVLTFKDALAQLFMDKEMMSLGHVLGELEPVGFDKDDKIQPQVEHMTNSIYNILEESANLMSAVLTNDRDYPVSSLVGLSHEATRTAGLTTRERTMETFPPPPHQSRNTQFSAKSSSSSGQGKQQMEELQTQYQQLQQRFEDDKKKYDEQLNHNTVLMMEMQDTIQALQKELSNLGNQAAELTKPQTAGADSPIMFTRNDLERNAKIMKRAVSDRRLPAEKYQDVVDTMDEYVSLPAKRLGHLVTKYVHHCQMKEIESNVRQSRRLDEDVFSTLDRMEALQNDRARRWAEHMDEMGSRRLELANMLMQKLNHIEEESGIFLIKPLFSYKAPAMSGRFISKMNRPQRMVREFAPTASTTLSQYAPLPTPATTIRPSRTSQGQRDEADAVSASVPIMGGTRPDNGLAGHSSQLLSDAQRPVWSQGLSQTHPLTEEMKNLQASHLNMPRILELDINRMLIGHNQISMKVPPMLGTNDRLVNAANTNVRSYMTVARPTGSHAVGSKTDRPRSHGGSENSVPPTTPMRDTHAASPIHGSRPSSHADLPPMSPSHQDTEERGRMSSRNLPSTPPLPPITPSAPADEAPEPPISPPGSSLHASPTPTSRMDTAHLILPSISS